MNKPLDVESFFLSIISIILEKHGCKIDDFDFKDRTISVAGSKKNQMECAAEIASNFSGPNLGGLKIGR
jgi:hypothetical protein